MTWKELKRSSKGAGVDPRYRRNLLKAQAERVAERDRLKQYLQQRAEIDELLNDVAARRCRFCSASLADQDPYDLLEWDDGELVCSECYHKHRGGERARAWEKFHRMTGVAPGWRIQ